MKRLLGLFLLLSACARPRPSVPQPPPLSPGAPQEANFVVKIDEIVEKAEEEGSSYANVFVDGAQAGQTSMGPKSREKRWEGALPVGNRLVRIEYWVLPGLADWARLPDQYQPRERFVRVEPGKRTIMAVRFHDKARRHSVNVSREEME